MFQFKEINEEEIVYEHNKPYEKYDYDHNDDNNPGIKTYIIIVAVSTFTSFAMIHFNKILKLIS